MAKKKAKGRGQKAEGSPDAIATAPSRNFEIPGCHVGIASQSNDGVPVEDLLSLAFNLAASNPGARVHFGITVIGRG